MAESTQIQASNNDLRNYGWQRSQDSIERVIWQAIENGEPWPTQLELEMATGLSRSTIQAHVKGLTLETIREHTRALGRKVLKAQAERAIKTGDHNEAKTYFKLNYDWKESQELNINATVTHSIEGKLMSELTPDERKYIADGHGDEYDLLPGGRIRRKITEAEFTDLDSQKQIVSENRELESLENGEIEA